MQVNGKNFKAGYSLLVRQEKHWAFSHTARESAEWHSLLEENLAISRLLICLHFDTVIPLQGIHSEAVSQQYENTYV